MSSIQFGTITDDNFQQQLHHKHLVVYFSANWCGPCKILSHTLKSLLDEFDYVYFMKCDIDDNAESAQKYNITSIPTLILFNAGKEKARIIGNVSRQTITDSLEKIYGAHTNEL